MRSVAGDDPTDSAGFHRNTTSPLETLPPPSATIFGRPPPPVSIAVNNKPHLASFNLENVRPYIDFARKLLHIEILHAIGERMKLHGESFEDAKRFWTNILAQLTHEEPESWDSVLMDLWRIFETHDNVADNLFEFYVALVELKAAAPRLTGDNPFTLGFPATDSIALVE